MHLPVAAQSVNAPETPMPLREWLPTTDPRDMESIRAHYEFEKILAARLRNADRSERRSLYTQLYDEYYSSIPDLPGQIAFRRQRLLTRQERWLRPMLRPDMTFLELGAGPCDLGQLVAGRVARVYVLDVALQADMEQLPRNCEFLLSDGTSVPAPPESVDLAYSHQMMEHLHPDDAQEQLRNIYRALKPGGYYFCATPNRLSGPWDISRSFDDVATGFHLREYTCGELIELFRSVGFRDFRAHTGYQGVGFWAAPGLVQGTERLVAACPPRWRKRFARLAPVRVLLNIKLLAQK